MLFALSFFFFFFNDTATTEIYTLSLHDALPIYVVPLMYTSVQNPGPPPVMIRAEPAAHCSIPNARTTPVAHRPSRSSSERDRKSTRLNSSHLVISYAVFCLKKKRDVIV